MTSNLPFSYNITQIFLALLPEANQPASRKKEKLSEIQDLLNLGIDLEYEIYPGFTPLCRVIETRGSKSLVELLLRYGAKIDIPNTEDFEWQDPAGKIIKNKILALSIQRYLQYKDTESLEIQKIIENAILHLPGHSKEPSPPSPRPPNRPAYYAEELISLEKRLYVFAFEHTIVNADFHHILTDMGVSPGRASQDLMEFLLEKYGLKDPECLQMVFKTILHQGDCISIATQSRYPETVLAALNKIGLTAEEKNKIFFEKNDYQQESDLTQGKNASILKSMLHFNMVDINGVFLIDPNTINLQIAKMRLNMAPHHLIKVEPVKAEGGNHWQEIIHTLRNPESISQEWLDRYVNVETKEVSEEAQDVKNTESASHNINAFQDFSFLNLQSVSSIKIDPKTTNEAI